MPKHLLLYAITLLACGTLSVALPKLTRIPALAANALSSLLFARLVSAKSKEEAPWAKAAALTYALPDAFVNRRMHVAAVRKIWLHRFRSPQWISIRCGYSPEMVARIKAIFEEGEDPDGGSSQAIGARLPKPPSTRTDRA